MLAEIAAATQDYITTPSVFADQLTAAGVSAWVIQQMKKSDWWLFKWIDDNSVLVTRTVSAFTALATTAGFQWKWDGTLAAGGDLHVHIPVLSAWLAFVWRSSGSFVMQQLIYQGVIKHEAGQAAADIVADKIVENKEGLAAAVVDEGLRKDPNSLLKLTDQPRKIQTPDDHLNRSEPELDDKPIDWGWKKKP